MKLYTFLIFLLISVLTGLNASANKLRILIVTGGHGFDRESFFQMFDSFNNLSYTELVHPEARAQLGTIDLVSFDAVVFYDMPKSITDDEKDGYYRLLKAGKGLLFLHHSICAYQDWPEFENIVGGKYYEKKKDDKFGVSSYQHDIDFTVKIVHPSHPVTKGLKNFVLHDEVYGNLEVIPEVYPLISTNHPKSNFLIGWTFKKEKSKIVFIQPGHDKNSYNNPDYRKLIKQAISYITGDNR
jgi:type 1 glutamine amidotransferase